MCGVFHFLMRSGQTQTCIMSNLNSQICLNENKHVLMEIFAVCPFRRDSEHFAGTEGKFGEDEGLLGRRLLPRSKHPLQRTQESHRCL